MSYPPAKTPLTEKRPSGPDGFPLFLAPLVEDRDLFGGAGFPVVGRLVDGFQVVVHCHLLEYKLKPHWLDIYIISHIVL